MPRFTDQHKTAIQRVYALQQEAPWVLALHYPTLPFELVEEAVEMGTSRVAVMIWLGLRAPDLRGLRRFHFAVSKGMLLNLLRHRRLARLRAERSGVVVSAFTRSAAEGAEDDADARAASVAAVVDALPSLRAREALWMLSSMNTVKGAAREMGVSVTTFKDYLERGRAQVADALGDPAPLRAMQAKERERYQRKLQRTLVA